LPESDASLQTFVIMNLQLLWLLVPILAPNAVRDERCYLMIHELAHAYVAPKRRYRLPNFGLGEPGLREPTHVSVRRCSDEEDEASIVTKFWLDLGGKDGRYEAEELVREYFPDRPQDAVRRLSVKKLWPPPRTIQGIVDYFEKKRRKR
jgi:hypothetical protein